jgi:hypothetical protein
MMRLNEVLDAVDDGGAWYRLENCEPKRGTAIRDNQNGDQLVVSPRPSPAHSDGGYGGW